MELNVDNVTGDESVAGLQKKLFSDLQVIMYLYIEERKKI